MYDCLPLCHSVGGVAALGAPLVNGGSVVVAERFSANRFWADVKGWDCTMVQYIGELCRYLLAAPPSPEEKAHRLRLACGNGLAADVWRAFAARFGAPQVLEFYASTEGNVTLYNVEGRVGAIGRQPSFLAARDAVALARFDFEREAPWRGADGLCARCGADEIGEALGRIAAEPGRRFEGYTEREATEKKILRDVFVRGDAWMRTGDLMRRDREGFYLFRRPHRRHVPLEGRERRERAKSPPRSASRPASATPSSTASSRPTPTARRAWRPWSSTARPISPRSLARSTPCPATRGRCSCACAPRSTQPPPSSRSAARSPTKASTRPGWRDPLYVYDTELEIYVELDAPRYAAIVEGTARL